jgi:Spy/CpxP family protein refolding chaperone
MKSKSMKIILLLSFIFNIAFLGSLGYRLIEKNKHQKARTERMEQGRTEFKEWLGLTDTQQERLEAIREEFPSQMRPMKKQIQGERKELIQLLREDPPDTAHIVSILDKIGQIQVGMQKEIVFQVWREKDVLSEEQREKFLKLVERRLGGDSYRRRGSSRRGESRNEPEPKNGKPKHTED